MIFSKIRLLTVVEASATNRIIDITSNLTFDKLLGTAMMRKCCQCHALNINKLIFMVP